MKNSVSVPAIGVFWSFASAFLWGTTFVCARFLFTANAVDPVTLNLARFTVGSMLLMGFGRIFAGKKMYCLTVKDAFLLAGLGLLGMVGMGVFLFIGQQYTTSINGALIMQVNPIFILFLAIGIGERIRPRQIAGIALSLGGCLVVLEVVTRNGIGYNTGHIKGDLFILLSAFCWAAYTVAGKPVVKRLGGYAVTAWAMTFGAVELWLLRGVLPVPHVWTGHTQTWLLALYLGVFPTAVAFFAWFEALDKIELSLLNVMQYLTPVCTVILAWFLLNEHFTAEQAVGAVLVLCGVLLTGFEKEKLKKT